MSWRLPTKIQSFRRFSQILKHFPKFNSDKNLAIQTKKWRQKCFRRGQLEGRERGRTQGGDDPQPEESPLDHPAPRGPVRRPRQRHQDFFSRLLRHRDNLSRQRIPLDITTFRCCGHQFPGLIPANIDIFVNRVWLIGPNPGRVFNSSGLYYKSFTIAIYDCNDSTIVEPLL